MISEQILLLQMFHLPEMIENIWIIEIISPKTIYDCFLQAWLVSSKRDYNTSIEWLKIDWQKVNEFLKESFCILNNEEYNIYNFMIGNKNTCILQRWKNNIKLIRIW